MQEIKLLPCPFCGAEPKSEQDGPKGWKIKCPSCVIMYKQKTLRFTVEWLRDRMVKTWNKRVGPHQSSLQQSPDFNVTICETKDRCSHQKQFNGMCDCYNMGFFKQSPEVGEDDIEKVARKILAEICHYENNGIDDARNVTAITAALKEFNQKSEK
jgi:hypothetical protein